MQTPPHLGGHCNRTHLDEGVLDCLIGLPIESMVDVGCGPGGMVKMALAKGIAAFGIDGDPNVINSNIRLHDFTYGPYEMDEVDLAWSVEFLEHVPEQCLDNVFSVFRKCKYVFCTHNHLPEDNGQHVNYRSNDYWRDIFYMYGFLYESECTKTLRRVSTMKRNFVRKTGQFFRRI